MNTDMEVLSSVRVERADDLYKIVDALNKALKDQSLIFGLALDPDDSKTMMFTIYRT